MTNLFRTYLLKLSMLCFCALTWSSSAWADGTYTTDDLITSGWSQVTTTEALNTAVSAGNLFILVDTRNSSMAMTCTAEPRPVYQLLTNPAKNVWQVWKINSKDGNYQLRNLSRNKEYLYAVTDATWNCFYTSDGSTTNSQFSFALSDGKWMLTNAFTNQYLGHWNDNELAAEVGEGIAPNKPLDQNYAAGFYIYTIGLNQYVNNIGGQAAQEITTYFVQNPSFETGDLTGWTQTYKNPDTPPSSEVGVHNLQDEPRFAMTNTDGNCLYNAYDEWRDFISIAQTINNLPAGEYEVSAVLATYEAKPVTFVSNKVRTAQQGSGDSNGILTTNVVSIGDDGQLTIEVRKDVNWWDFPDGNPNQEYINFFKADDFRLRCNGIYLAAWAETLPNDNITELIPGQWYVYDAASSGDYQLTGDLGNMVYTTNGQQFVNQVSAINVDNKIQFEKGKVYFKTATSGATLQITQESVLNDNEITFTTCALNVDGLPNIDLGVVQINGDGAGEEKSPLIGQYLNNKLIDIIGVSEDFNYNDLIYNEMSSNYYQGTWRGKILTSGLSTGGLMRSDTDGLNIFVRNTFQFGPSSEGYNINWQLWERQEGAISDGDGGQFDMLVKKGFRYYEVTLKPGFVIDVFVLHMDAGSRTGDSGTSQDGLDALARNEQLLQLSSWILNNKDNGRPKIIIGDTNCRYTRDKVKANFIDVINEDGRYFAKDAWVELIRNNVYPVYDTPALTNGKPNEPTCEIVDKIIYLNPTTGTHKVQAVNCDIDDTYTLGDHEPVVVTFKTIGASNTSAEQSSWWCGEDPVATADAGPFYLYNVGYKVFATDAEMATISDIHRAVRWRLNKEDGYDDNQRTISRNTGWRFKRLGDVIGTSGDARVFSITNHNNDGRVLTPGAYHLQWKIAGTNWLCINEKGEYDDGNDESGINKEWLFISQEQKDAYDEYIAAYNNAQLLMNLPNFSKKTELQTLLAAADGEHANYNNCKGANGYTAQLKSIYNDALAEYNDYISIDESAAIVNNGFENDNMAVWTYNTSVYDSGRKSLNDNAFRFTATDGASLGSYAFNTWDSGTTKNHYIQQTTASLPAGYYVLKVYVASDIRYTTTMGTSGNTDEGYNNRTLLYLTVNDQNYSIVVDHEKNQGVPYEVLVYHPGGTMTVGANSHKTWNYSFKLDEFSLTRYADYYDVKMTNVKFTTLTLPIASIIPENITAFKCVSNAINSNAEDKTLTLVSIDSNILPKNTPVILRADNVDITDPIYFRFNYSNSTEDAPSDNTLRGTPDDRLARPYEAHKEEYNNANYTVFVLSKKTIGGEVVSGMFMLNERNAQEEYNGIPRFRAYYTQLSSTVPSAKDFVLFSFGDSGDGTDGISQQVFIPADGTITDIYSVNGMRQSQLQRGINIVRMSDGSLRKIMVK